MKIFFVIVYYGLSKHGNYLEIITCIAWLAIAWARKLMVRTIYLNQGQLNRKSKFDLSTAKHHQSEHIEMDHLPCLEKLSK